MPGQRPDDDHRPQPGAAAGSRDDEFRGAPVHEERALVPRQLVYEDLDWPGHQDPDLSCGGGEERSGPG